ncbi:MAG: hypothetical protein H6830_10240 [Planctomycetes bacterium]|nr:hypothetical protein [Planctomycetota bacterium]MCB9909492.1 hypothetical protein [Planctomycetota bacterium]MCB9912541.1 hypothetical protein [Planctomycetota bacterium]HPF15518.1 hypothetical protein [Planctomycetota bacterium]
MRDLALDREYSSPMNDPQYLQTMPSLLSLVGAGVLVLAVAAIVFDLRRGHRVDRPRR